MLYAANCSYLERMARSASFKGVIEPFGEEQLRYYPLRVSFLKSNLKAREEGAANRLLKYLGLREDPPSDLPHTSINLIEFKDVVAQIFHSVYQEAPHAKYAIITKNLVVRRSVKSIGGWPSFITAEGRVYELGELPPEPAAEHPLNIRPLDNRDYETLPLEKLTDETFEELPKIYVKISDPGNIFVAIEHYRWQQHSNKMFLYAEGSPEFKIYLAQEIKRMRLPAGFTTGKTGYEFNE